MVGIRHPTEDGGDASFEVWLRDGAIEAFLWLERGRLVHLQLCAGSDLAEWQAGGVLRTAYVEPGQPGSGLPGLREGNLLMDRRPSPERRARLAAAVARAGDPELRAFFVAVLTEPATAHAGPELLARLSALPLRS